MRGNSMKITNYKSSSISQKTQVSTSKAIENNLKDGQIEGSVSRENGKTLLELANGEKIEVKLQADVPMGKAMTFSAFKNAAGEIILKLSPATQKSIIMDNLVRNLQLPDTPQMKELISLFMSKSLPLDRQDLIKANFAVKTFDLPAQTITNLAEKSLNLTSGQLEIAKNLQQNGTLPLAQNISDLIELLPNQKVLEFLANKLNLPTNNAATTATPANAATTALRPMRRPLQLRLMRRPLPLRLMRRPLQLGQCGDHCTRLMRRPLQLRPMRRPLQLRPMRRPLQLRPMRRPLQLRLMRRPLQLG